MLLGVKCVPFFCARITWSCLFISCGPDLLICLSAFLRKASGGQEAVVFFLIFCRHYRQQAVTKSWYDYAGLKLWGDCCTTCLTLVPDLRILPQPLPSGPRCSLCNHRRSGCCRESKGGQIIPKSISLSKSLYSLKSSKYLQNKYSPLFESLYLGDTNDRHTGSRSTMRCREHLLDIYSVPNTKLIWIGAVISIQQRNWDSEKLF